MTDQHRATPDQWALVASAAAQNQRIAALEAAQLDQAESHRFCTDAIVRRVEALEATQHAHADVSRLSDAEREQFYAELAKPGTWRPLDIETTYGSKAAVDAAQILRAPMVVEGTFEHGGETYRFKAKPEPESAMTELRAASAEAQPAGGLVERVAAKVEYDIDAEQDPEGIARAAIRDVAAWLRELHPSPGMASAALRLEQEANHG